MRSSRWTAACIANADACGASACKCRWGAARLHFVLHTQGGTARARQGAAAASINGLARQTITRAKHTGRLASSAPRGDRGVSAGGRSTPVCTTRKPLQPWHSLHGVVQQMKKAADLGAALCGSRRGGLHWRARCQSLARGVGVCLWQRSPARQRRAPSTRRPGAAHAAVRGARDCRAARRPRSAGAAATAQRRA